VRFNQDGRFYVLVAVPVKVTWEVGASVLGEPQISHAQCSLSWLNVVKMETHNKLRFYLFISHDFKKDTGMELASSLIYCCN
jgi:hypothetical protein